MVQVLYFSCFLSPCPNEFVAGESEVRYTFKGLERVNVMYEKL
jgi:hypothetical protein